MTCARQGIDQSSALSGSFPQWQHVRDKLDDGSLLIEPASWSATRRCPAGGSLLIAAARDPDRLPISPDASPELRTVALSSWSGRKDNVRLTSRHNDRASFISFPLSFPFPLSRLSTFSIACSTKPAVLSDHASETTTNGASCKSGCSARCFALSFRARLALARFASAVARFFSFALNSMFSVPISLLTFLLFKLSINYKYKPPAVVSQESTRQKRVQAVELSTKCS